MVNFKCIIKSRHAEDPYKNLTLSEDEGPVMLEVLIAQVKSEHKVPGLATLHQSRRDGDIFIPDKEINDSEFFIQEDETLFLLYDEKVHVIDGGFGSGAQTDPSNSDENAVAQGGGGTGGRLDDSGRSKGGSGFGGHLYSETGGGTGGRGFGGTVKGQSVKAGSGVGGRVIQKLHPSLDHTRKEQGTSKSVSSIGSTHEHGVNH